MLAIGEDVRPGESEMGSKEIFSVSETALDMKVSGTNSILSEGKRRTCRCCFKGDHHDINSRDTLAGHAGVTIGLPPSLRILVRL